MLDQSDRYFQGILVCISWKSANLQNDLTVKLYADFKNDLTPKMDVLDKEISRCFSWRGVSGRYIHRISPSASYSNYWYKTTNLWETCSVLLGTRNGHIQSGSGQYLVRLCYELAWREKSMNLNSVPADQTQSLSILITWYIAFTGIEVTPNKSYTIIQCVFEIPYIDIMSASPVTSWYITVFFNIFWFTA